MKPADLMGTHAPTKTPDELATAIRDFLKTDLAADQRHAFIAGYLGGMGYTLRECQADRLDEARDEFLRQQREWQDKGWL